MVSKQIEISVKKEVIKEIDELIDRYKYDGVQLSQLKRYFKTKSAINTLIKDINEIGKRQFDSDQEYYAFIVKLVKEILIDNISEEETNKIQNTMNEVKKFSEFEYQKESFDYKDITPEYLFDGIEAVNKNKDIEVLSTYFKTNKDYINVLDTNYCVYTITDFKADILNNNRVKMNVLLLSDDQIKIMKDNISKKVISGIYEQIPQNVEYMGIMVNPYTVLDKARIKEAIDSIVDKNILELISSVTKYNYLENTEEKYHIWRKVK